MSAFVERTWVSADGLSLSARDYPSGEGPARLPVICLHGLTRNARDFEEVAPVIAATGRRVLAVDVRGRGRSAWASDPMSYQPPVYAGDVQALTAAAGIARAVFIGTSMGGLIISALAAFWPPLVAAVALNDVGPVIGAAGLERILAYTGGAVAVASWDEAAAYARRTNQSAFPSYGDDDWARAARRLFREAPAGGLVLDYDPAISAPLQAAPAGAAPDLWPLFEALLANRPSLLLRGALSDILDRDTADALRRLVPAMRYAEAPGVGHAPMLTEPDARGALLAFLADCP